ncbi:DMT family transporter [bacterium]|nr:DMT family transporter [bacterium]
MNPKYKAPIILMAANMCYVCSFSLAKYFSIQVPVALIMLARFLAGPIYLTPYFWATKKKLHVKHYGLFALRIGCGVSAMTSLFYAFKYADIGTTMLIFESSAIWTLLLGYFLFKNRPHAYSLMAIPLAVVGMVLVVKPHAVGGIGLGHGFALLGSLFNAGVYISLKQLRHHYDTSTIVWVTYCISALILAGPAAWTLPELTTSLVGGLMLMCSVGFLGQLCMTMGFKFATAGISSLLMLSIIPLTTLSGMIVFNESHDIGVWMGMGAMVIALGVIGRWQ